MSHTFLCTISRTSPDNWTLCKQTGLWGVARATKRRMSRIEVGDRLFVWLGGRGFVAEAVVAAPPRPPRNASEAPWEGGLYRFTFVIPIEVIRELAAPIRL